MKNLLILTVSVVVVCLVMVSVAMGIGAGMEDSGTLAYTTERYSGYDITLMDMRTRATYHLLRVMTPYMGEMAWTEDGNTLAFMAWYRGGINLHLLDMHTRDVTHVTHVDERMERPMWLTDDREIVFASDETLYIINLENGLRTTLMDGDDGRSPSLAGNRDTLAFASRRNGSSNIFTVSIETGNITEITRTRNDDKFPTWSSDGQRLAFMRWNNQYDIYVVDLATGVEQPLITGESVDASPAWSASGRYLAYVSMRNGWQDVYMMDTQTGQEERITAVAARNEFVTWVP